jgi:hypothetical protein
MQLSCMLRRRNQAESQPRWQSEYICDVSAYNILDVVTKQQLYPNNRARHIPSGSGMRKHLAFKQP